MSKPRQIKAGHEVLMDALPTCDFCSERGTHRLAEYDGKTVFGPWANMCVPHFRQHGVGTGLGKGQRFILRKEGA